MTHAISRAKKDCTSQIGCSEIKQWGVMDDKLLILTIARCYEVWSKVWETVAIWKGS